MDKHTSPFVGAALAIFLVLGACTNSSSTGASQSDASLSSLSVSGASLTPVFSPSTIAYSATVENETSSASILAVPNSSGATIAATISPPNGAAVAPIQLANQVPLLVGDNLVKITVTSADGSTVKTYRLTISRKQSSLATDASLSSMSAGGSMIGLVAGTYAYSQSFPSGTTSTSIVVTPSSSTALVSFDGLSSTGALGANGLMTFTDSLTGLSAGTKTVTIVLGSADGSSTATYTLAIIVAAGSLSTDATLATLSSSVSFSPAFLPTVLDYSALVSNSVTSATVHATKHDGTATIAATLNGAAYALDASASLVVGANVFAIKVTAADGTTAKTYTLTIDRATGGTGSISVGVLLSSQGDLSFTGAGPSLAQGQTWALQAYLPGATAFSWLLDGTEVSTASTYSLSGSSLSGGPHTIGLSALVSGHTYFCSLYFLATAAPAPTILAVAVSLAADDLSFAATSDTICSGQSFAFTASLSGASSFDWYLDGALAVSGQQSYAASADAIEAGPHCLTATAVVGGKTYSGSFYFNVQKTLGPGSLNLIVACSGSADLSFSGFGSGGSGTPILRPGEAWNLVPSFGAASSYAWYVDGAQVATSSTLTIDPSQNPAVYFPGPHNLSLFATVNNRDYSGYIYFTVSN